MSIGRGARPSALRTVGALALLLCLSGCSMNEFSVDLRGARVFDKEAAVCVPLVSDAEMREDTGTPSSIEVTVQDAEQVIDDRITYEIRGVLKVVTSEVANYAWTCNVEVDASDKRIVGTLESFETMD